MSIDNNFYKRDKDQLTLKEIAELTGSKLNDPNDAAKIIKSVNSLSAANPDEIAFLDTRDFAKKDASKEFDATKAGACFVKEAMDVKSDTALLINKEPLKAFVKTISAFFKISEFTPGIDENAYISDKAKFKDKNKVSIGAGAVIEAGAEIGENVTIKSGAVIKENCKIGDGTVVYENAVIQYAEIGANVIIHPGAKIGTDGFGYILGESHTKLPHMGKVIIGDYAEIGVNTAVDRGFLADTEIGAGTKIDNLVQISHNVKTGVNCVIAGQSGIAGSAELGNYVFFGAQVGVTDHVKIGDMSQLGARTGATKSFPANSKLMGYPATDMKQYLKIQALLRRMIKKS